MLRRILALVAGLVCALLVPEIAYRIFRTGALSPTTNPSYVVHDELLGWAYRPNARERHASDEFDVEVAINSHGFRGPEWPDEKRSRRVLLLGDSMAFGWGVPEQESLRACLQVAHPDWEVLSAAVSGYATDQELLLLRQLRTRAWPDVVVCVFSGNDLWEAATERAYGHCKPRFVEHSGEHDGKLELVGVPVPYPWLERTSALWRAIQKKRSSREPDPTRASDASGAPGASGASARDAEREWSLARALFRAMRDELAGAPLVIVSGEERLAQFARNEAGMRHLDTRPIFDRAPGLVFERDGHWNASGHAAVARALDPLLADWDHTK